MKLRTVLAATVLSTSSVVVDAQGTPCIICPSGLTVAPDFVITFPDANGSGGGSTTCEDIISIAEIYQSGTEDCDGLTTEVETFCCPPTLPPQAEAAPDPERPQVPGAAVTTPPNAGRPPATDETKPPSAAGTLPPNAAVTTIIEDGDKATAFPTGSDPTASNGTMTPVTASSNGTMAPVTASSTGTMAPTTASVPTAATTPAPTSNGTAVVTEGMTPTVGGKMTLAPTAPSDRPPTPITTTPPPVVPAQPPTTSSPVSVPAIEESSGTTTAAPSIPVSMLPPAGGTPTMKPTAKPVAPTQPSGGATATHPAVVAKSGKMFKAADSVSSTKAAKSKAAKLLKGPGAKSSKAESGKAGKSGNGETVSRPSTKAGKSSKAAKSSKNGKGAKAGQVVGLSHLDRYADHSYFTNGAESMVCCRQGLGIVSMVVASAFMAWI